MATTRIIPMHIGKGKSIAQSIRDRTDYVKNPDKTQQGEFISAYECDIATVDAEFLLLKNQYHHKTGRRQNRKNDVLAYQIRQAFKPGEITPEEANRIGYELAISWTKQNYPFVGPSGSGKSTIAKLIDRFWDAKGGEVRIGGIDIRKIPKEQLTQIISFVTQDITIFEMSIHENIQLGNPNASFDEVVKASQAACCHDFIVSLPDGYDTKLGKEISLSGGEKQRISLARAILKNAPILVLDEATAYCDPDNEAELQKALSALAKGKTVIVIAHRLSSVADADQILLIKDGCLVAHGTHDDLLNHSTAYSDMWQAFLMSERWFARREEHV